MEVVELECCTLLAVSALQYTEEKADKDTEVLSNGRRDNWGNLWEL